MIKSMTGFGKGEATFESKKFIVEMRSVNSKQLDLSIKIPGKYRAAEAEIRAIVTRIAKRGKVDCFVNVESLQTESSAHINAPLFSEYAKQMRQAAELAGLDHSSPEFMGSMLQSLMRLPDIVTTQEEAVSDKELEALVSAAEMAAEALDDFREQEGSVLIADLLRRVDNIEQYKVEVEPFEKARVETIKSRIREHIEKIGVEVDHNRLEQEMIYYIEKLDITEEKVRLKNHCNYFREVASSEPEAGRKLGFIAQEMGREINTLGSKSNESNMQILVVKMKDELEKIKEQVLNIL